VWDRKCDYRTRVRFVDRRLCACGSTVRLQALSDTVVLQALDETVFETGFAIHCSLVSSSSSFFTFRLLLRLLLLRIHLLLRLCYQHPTSTTRMAKIILIACLTVTGDAACLRASHLMRKHLYPRQTHSEKLA